MRIDLYPRSPSYRPGQTVLGRFVRLSEDTEELRAVELSVLWYTEGKGDEDMSVHFFRRIAADTAHTLDAAHPLEFAFTLPLAPLSYDGEIVKIRWCARARTFPRRGRQQVVEQQFRLCND